MKKNILLFTCILIAGSFNHSLGQFVGGIAGGYGANTLFQGYTATSNCCSALGWSNSASANYSPHQLPCPGSCLTYNNVSQRTGGVPGFSLVGHNQYISFDLTPAPYITSLTLPPVPAAPTNFFPWSGATIQFPAGGFLNCGNIGALPAGYSCIAALLPAGSPIEIRMQEQVDFGAQADAEINKLPITMCLSATTPKNIGVSEVFTSLITAGASCSQKRFYLGAPARCSFDPNKKVVYPEGCTSKGLILPADTLTYSIMFQNTGTDTARVVRIIDTLSSNIDTASFQLLYSTAPVIAHFISPRVVEFRFDSINLPDSLTSGEMSKGIVGYSVAPKSTVMAGDQIKNKSYIYFDANAPIITNQTINTISDSPMKMVSIANKVREICNGNSTIFTASPAQSYLWSTGATTSSINASNAGTYVVTAQYQYSCPSSDTAILIVNPTPTVSVGSNQTIYKGCGPQCKTLSATASGGTAPYSYNWSTGQTTQNVSVCPKNTTTYSVILTDSKGCTATDEVVVIVRCNCTGNQILITQANILNPLLSTAICVAPNQVAGYLSLGGIVCTCGKIGLREGGDDSSFDLESNVAENKIAYTEAYPNPFDKNTTIEFSVPKGRTQIEVYNVTGQLINTLFDKEIISDFETHKVDFNCSSLSKGIYYYHLKHSQGTFIKKLIIQ